MPKRFTATENAIDKGLAETTPAAGRKLVADWATELDKADFPGAKGISGDLDRLEKALAADEPDAEKVGGLIRKLGEATVKAADRAEDEAMAEKVRALGEALTSQAA